MHSSIVYVVGCLQEKYKEKEQKQKKLNAEQAASTPKESASKGKVKEHEVSGWTKETSRVRKTLLLQSAYGE